MDEREFELLNILGRELGSNQRDLSQKMDLSLGMVNMLIRRLVTKGYIRMEQLNKRKAQYILTPKGFAEKTSKSIKYTMNTLNSIGLIKEGVKDIFSRLYKEGYRKFYIYSESDLTILIEKAFHELHLQDAVMGILKSLPEQELDGILMLGYENIPLNNLQNTKVMNLLAEISQGRDVSRL